jgi:hypothetical protein
MAITKDEIIKEFFEKGISPTLDAKNWKGRDLELSDLALHAKFYKIHLIIEHSIELTQAHRDELRFAGKQWVLLR